jgi:hypothetical protein
MFGSKRTRKILLYSIAWSLLGVGIMHPVLSAHAEEDAPFEFDSGKWMSFERYKDVAKAKAKLPPQVDKITESPETVDAQPKGVESAAPKNLVKVAAPSRPINLPVLPGMNKGFGIHVESTSDKDDTVGARIANIDTNPELAISGDKWQKTSELTKTLDIRDRHVDADGEEKIALEVRPSFLPNSNIKPVNLIPERSGRRAVAEALAKKRMAADVAPKAEKSPTELAACAAVDAFKKKQLAAIQSDRQTLVALQSAITTLGLQKQLSFMTDVQGSLNVQTDTAAKIDTPASTAQP